MVRAATTVLLVCALVAPAIGVAIASDSPDSAAAAGSGSQAARLSALSDAVERDRERLKQLISREDAADSTLEESPELREIAERLPALQAELQALRSRAGAADR